MAVSNKVLYQESSGTPWVHVNEVICGIKTDV